VGTAFVGWLYGVDLSSTQIATVAIVSVLTSFSIPGIPAGSIIVMVPVLASVGLPAEGIGVLLGVDTIPDAFRTTANVSGQMALAAIAGRASEAAAPATAAEGAGAAAGAVGAPGSPAPN
jgi:Na+/H+-dicarboxylate symporter